MPRLSRYISQRQTDSGAPLQAVQRETTSLALSTDDAVLQNAVNAISAKHLKRVQESGPRQFRQPDGSLSAVRPSNSAFAVANRRMWQELVLHCRTNGGGDVELQQHGRSLRYMINASHTQHAQLLAAIGLTLEVDGDGQWVDYDPAVARPLVDDAEHPFHCAPWQQFAEAVFAAAPFQWHDGIARPVLAAPQAV